jgi:hypothetical protein
MGVVDCGIVACGFGYISGKDALIYGGVLSFICCKNAG